MCMYGGGGVRIGQRAVRGEICRSGVCAKFLKLGYKLAWVYCQYHIKVTPVVVWSVVM